ncbi:tetratricopeptide repeat protein [Nocardia sp. NPDC127579]|uniref:caspase, EACC1-associated type n=1 Tax=Nocardia sp. NPDC127579 TaxID=3345402 RepID=UPI00363F8ACC
MLIGVGRYRDRGALPDLPAVWANLVDLERALADPESGSFDRAECRVVSDPENSSDVAAILAAASDEATDVLLIYWAGHGVVDQHGRGYLALGSTIADRPGSTAFSMDLLREVFETSRAANRILLLDSCYSGRNPLADRWLDSDAPGLAVLASTASVPSYSGATHTAFTEALLSALATTESASLDQLWHSVHHRLAIEGGPEARYHRPTTPDLLLRRHIDAAVEPGSSTPSTDKRPHRWRRPIGLPPQDSGSLPASANNQAIDLLDRYQRSGDSESLSTAVNLLRTAVALTEAEDPEYLSNLATALLHVFDRTGALTALEEAIQLSRAAIGTAASPDPGRAWLLSNLGGALQRLYERTGEPASLDEAIEVGRAAIMEADDPNRAGYLSNLGAALRLRFETRGDSADLEESVAACREAVAAVPDSDPSLGVHLTNYGLGLLALYERTESAAHLDEAAQVFEIAVRSTEQGHRHRASRLNNLAAALLRKAVHDNDSRTLRQAVEVLREATAVNEPDHPDQARYLSNLGAALQLVFDRSGEAPLLDESVRCARLAIDLTPLDHPDHALNLYRLGRALRLRTGLI